MFLCQEKTMSIPSCLRPLRGGSPCLRAWRGLGLVLAVVVLGGGRPAAAQYTFIDLHPSGFTRSVAWGVSDGQQVGSGTIFRGPDHALLWTGSADSVVDLHPAGLLTRTPGASATVSRWARATPQTAFITPCCGRGAPTVWSTSTPKGLLHRSLGASGSLGGGDGGMSAILQQAHVDG
jgi:hypothetical protein